MESGFRDQLIPEECEPLDLRYLETALRRKLMIFFMNPVEKWYVKRMFPYKFAVQLVKIVLVTIQLCLFATSRYNHINYTWDNKIAFSNLFLMNWDAVREVPAYPPTTGPLALYDKRSFYDSIDYAFNGYLNISEAIGPYSYSSENNHMVPPDLCIYHYKEGQIFGFNESYIFNSEIEKRCFKLIMPENATLPFSVSKYMDGFNITFSAFVKASLNFSIKTVNFKAAGPLTLPDCYKFKIRILYNNEDMDGQVLISLDVEPLRLDCKGDIDYIVSPSRVDYILRTVLNCTVILVCLVSFILCFRAVIRAQQLKFETITFFRHYYAKELSIEGRCEFWNLWYVMIIANDVLIITGSAIKEEIERKQFVGDQWNVCSIYLGIGNLLVWFGVLRYLGFFKTYNVIILTMKKAFPKVARFSFCAFIIYAGFTFCGWLVLGPYHLKFRTLGGTSECLFALINGDDMYATFSIMEGKTSLLWWFSRIYLYSFISLYIYVVLSLFISIIMDAYETIKQYYKEGFPKSDLQKFLTEGSEESFQSPRYDSFRSNDTAASACRQFCTSLLCCQVNPSSGIAGKNNSFVSVATEYGDV